MTLPPPATPLPRAAPPSVRRQRPFGPASLALTLCLGLAACQTAPTGGLRGDNSGTTEADADADRDEAPVVSVQVSPAMARLFPGWQPKPMPGKRWAPFEWVEQDGQPGLQVLARGTLSILGLHLNAQPPTAPATLRFSWWVERLLPEANLLDSTASDSPARMGVTFGGDRKVFAPRDHLLSELLHLMTGEPLPHATLVYVWANDLAPGTVLTSPRTQRIRYLVVEQGTQHLGQWVRHQRDVRADFERVFNEPPGPIVGLALMTDTDNTGGHTRTVYGPVSLAEH